MSIKFNKDLTGKVINGLTFLQLIPRSNTPQAYWLLKCVCLNEFINRADAIKSGKTKSCGCLTKELVRNSVTTHGFSRNEDQIKINFFKIYTAMKQRCLNPNNPAYKDYGGRGIKICKRWLKSFENFRDDMWDEYFRRITNEETISIERKRVNGDYKPSNCRWATPDEQGKNKRISVRSINIELHNYWKRKIQKMVSYNVHFNVGKRSSKIVEKYVGCTVEFLRQHLASQFKKGMSWDNYGVGKYKWQIDHIKRIREFDLAIEKNRYECFHYSNLQPMWGWANNEKH